MLFEPITKDEMIGSHKWLRRFETGRQGQPNYRVFDFLPRISVSKARRIVESVRRSPSSGPLRDQLMEMIRHGLGVPQDLNRLPELRDVALAADPDKLAAFNAYLDGLDASIDAMERYMNPWPYLPSAEWVASAIGCEAWPFFPRTRSGDYEVQVPKHAAYGVLIYMQDSTESKTYTLCDSYVLKRKHGVVAIPSLFAHQHVIDVEAQKILVHNAELATEALNAARSRKASAEEIQRLVDISRRATEAKAKKQYKLRSRIKGKIDVTGVMKSDRRYFALFGVFYFAGHEDQTGLMRDAFKVDVHTNIESDVFGSEALQRKRQELDDKRKHAQSAREYVERYRTRVGSPNPPAKLLASYAKAEKVASDFDKASRRYHDAAERPLKDSPLLDLSFYALDVLLPSTFKPTEVEWRPLLTPKYARVAERLYGNDKSVKKERTLKFSMTPKGSRIW